jgi:sugar/nucleoside kinase (ribokinase family)
MARYEVTCIGNFTKDTIVNSAGQSVVYGGGFNYGCHAARALRKRTAAITRLSVEDKRVVEELEGIGVDVFPAYCEHSTCLRLEYPTDNPDERILKVTQVADPITPREVESVESRAYVVGPSFRGEVEIGTLELLATHAEILSVDVQGFVRTIEKQSISYSPWDDQKRVFRLATIVKADAAEAEYLTGSADRRRACEILHERGAREIILTHRDGILVFDGRHFFEAPFVAMNLTGRSGRGDTCVSSYVSRRLEDEPKEAILWSAALTSRKLEAPGPFMGSYEEIAEVVETLYRGGRAD